VTAIALASQYGMALEAPTALASNYNVLSCMACSTVMDAVDGIFEWGVFQKILLTISEYVCIFFKLADEPVRLCPQIVP